MNIKKFQKRLQAYLDEFENIRQQWGDENATAMLLEAAEDFRCIQIQEESEATEFGVQIPAALPKKIAALLLDEFLAPPSNHAQKLKGGG